MPKAGSSKKRKRESKKDQEHDAKKAKSQRNDGLHKNQEQDLTNVSNLPSQEQQEIDDIDEKLEQNAAKNNLTTINVKSILHVSFRMKTKRHIMSCCYYKVLLQVPSDGVPSLFRGRHLDLSQFLLHM